MMILQPSLRGLWAGRVQYCALALLACAASACNDPGRRSPPIAEVGLDRSSTLTADAVLDRTIQAYQQAKSYRDKGSIELEIDGTEGKFDRKFDCHVEFQRPNLMRLKFNFVDPRSGPEEILVVADGKRIFCKPPNVENQVVVASDPPVIEVPKIYDTKDLVLPDGMTGPSFALIMLAAKDPLAQLDRTKAKLLPPKSIDGQACDRIEFANDGGPKTLWINQQTALIRRVEYSTTRFVEDNKDNGVTGAKLTAEFPDAVLNPKIEPAQFTWTESKDERYVRQVVPPLDPAEAPSKLLGKPVPDVTFVTSAGEKRDSKSLIGKVTVLDFWATFCPPCKEGMPEIEAVRKQYAGNDKVQFLALSTDGPDTSEAQIVETLKAIGVNPPWGRISAEEFFRQFEVDQTIPVLVILGANGTIQVLHIGLLKDTPTSLPAMIEAVLKGDDVIKQARDAWEARQREYQQQLQQATVDIHAAIVEIPRGKIAAATEPAAHKLVPLWTAADVTGPGNLLALPPLVSNASEPQSKHSPGPLDSRILVIDQMHDVVELNRAGKVVARHKQFIPNNPPLTWLRSAAEKDGQRFFVLGAVGQDQFYVFDGNWQLALKYPADPSAKIFDVQPGDLDGDGKLDFGIGYFGEAGVQAVSLAGKRLFNNATILDVTHLVIAPLNLTGERGLLCTHQGGTLVPIRSDGEAETPLQLSGHAISHVATADLDGDGRAEGCVLASATNESGSRQIAGLHLESAGWKFTWNRPIPSGEHELIIEAVSSGHIETGKPGIWIVAGADGSVHFFAADGTPVDQFNTGGILTGVATAVIEGKPALLVAHPDKLQAFRIEKK